MPREESPQTLRKFSSDAAYSLYEQINQAHNSERVDELARIMWQGFGEGAISEDDAAFLDELIRRRRPPSRVTAPGFHKALGPIAGRIGSRFKPRRSQRSPDRAQSIERRRQWAASSSMPPPIRGSYSEAERAAMAVIASEVKRQGNCDWPLDRIAATAGVSRSTVQNALREAHRLGHATSKQRPVRGRKNLTSIVDINSREWLAWIKRAPAASKAIGFKPLNPTKNIERKQEERKKEATEKEVRIGSKTVSIPGEFVFVDTSYRGKCAFVIPSGGAIIQSPSDMGSIHEVIAIQGLKKGRMRNPKIINIQNHPKTIIRLA